MVKNALPLPSRGPFPHFCRLATFLISGIFLLVGCTPHPPTPSGQTSPESEKHSQSLLLSTPFIGEETTLRDPVPQPVRVQLGDESVEGWLVPSEKVLRFPIDLKDGYKLSFRLGIAAGPYKPIFSRMLPPVMPVPPPIKDGALAPPSVAGSFEPPPDPQANLSTTLPEIGELSLKVEFAPIGKDGKLKGEPSIVYELSPDDFTKTTREWLLVDLPLDKTTPSKGELWFVADGSKAGNQDFQVLWGQPTLYLPKIESFKNILLIGVDTLRADAISPLGGRLEVTPNLQAFSEGATVFTQAHSQAPWTLPSFASIVTGLMPSRAIEAEMGQLISNRTTTVGEYILPAGLATYTVCSSAWLGGSKSGFQKGMEGFSYLLEPRAQIQVEAAMKFIDRSQDMGRDWFCFIHLIDPHTPYQPPDKYINQFCDSNYSGQYSTSIPEDGWGTGDKKPSQDEIDHARCLYDCEVANVDSALQDLFRFLDEKGLTKDTLIIFCADHGEEFNEHGRFGHGKTQYEEQVHVPLIVKGPGFPAGKRIDDPVANLDILPTIFRYLDIKQPESIGGIPLQDTVSGEIQGNRVILGEESLYGSGFLYSLTWPFKCILEFNKEESTFYNLVNDSGETKEVQEANREIMTELLASLSNLIRPETSAIHVWISGYENKDHKFVGKIRLPGGIEKVQTYLLDTGDTYTVNGDTLDFSISSLINQPLGADKLMPHRLFLFPLPYKHLLITPSIGSESVNASVTVDGEISDNRFFPFGNKAVNSTGSASLTFNDFPMTPVLPMGTDKAPDSLIIWGVRGTRSEKPPEELDPQTLEQLKALGYVN